MNIQNVVNAIRTENTEFYQSRVPVATQENLESIRFAMLEGDDNIAVANEFVGTMLNKIVKSVVHTKVYNNPLKTLKKGKKPLGDGIEEIYANFVKCKQFDASGAELLTRVLPDVKTVYHRMNRQDKYKITVSREQLTKAFKSWDALEKFITNYINTLYNSAELDEFVIMKQMFAAAIESGAMKTVEISDPTDETNGVENGKKFIKAVKIVSGMMKNPSAAYNGYLNVQSTDKEPLLTFTRPEEQVLILDTPTDVNINVEVLANTFNKSVSEFNDTAKIVIDAFPGNENIRACLIDEQFIQMFDDLFEVRAFDNGEGLYTNYYLHVWQTVAYSPLVNAVAFVVPFDGGEDGGEDTNGDGEITLFPVTFSIQGEYTMTNNKTQVKEGSSYKNTLTAGNGGSWSVGDILMSNAAGYDMVDYTLEGDKLIVNIPKVTGEISFGCMVDGY